MHSTAIRIFLVCFCLSISQIVFAHDSFEEPHSNDENLSEETQFIKERLNNMNAVIDLRYTDYVGEKINNYTVRGKHETEKLLARYSMYAGKIENEIYSRNLPDILKFIPIIESELKPNARSRSGAVGMWQFMKGTAKNYGLRINSKVDERKDSERSTEAALDYLTKLYDRFGDWSLAIAAYNCGPGNMRKAIKKSGGSRDFYVVSKYLKKETQNYIPKLIAAKYMMNYYHAYDIVPNFSEQLYFSTSATKVHDKIGLEEIANTLDLELEILHKMNAHFKKKYIPKSEKGYNVVLPAESLHDFYVEYQPYKIKPEEHLAATLIVKKKPIVKKSLIATAKRLERIKILKIVSLDTNESVSAISE